MEKEYTPSLFDMLFLNDDKEEKRLLNKFYKNYFFKENYNTTIDPDVKGIFDDME